MSLQILECQQAASRYLALYSVETTLGLLQANFPQLKPQIIKEIIAEGRKPTVPVAPATEVPVKSTLDYALACAGRGWYVLPCEPGGKLPENGLIAHGVNSASDDPEVIKSWFDALPDINYAVAGGDASGLSFFDYDDLYSDDIGVDFPESEYPDLYRSFRVRSGRVNEPEQNGGFHLYVRGAVDSHALFADAALPTCERQGINKKNGQPLVDKSGNPIMQTFDRRNRLVVKGRVAVGEVRSRGEYVIGAGSLHKSGRRYEIVTDAPLASNPIADTEINEPATPAIGSDKHNAIAGFVEAAFEKSGVDYTARESYQNGFKWLIECPWNYEHSGGKTLDGGGSSSAVFMAASGALGYRCLHAHCQSTRNWAQLREYMEGVAGKLSFAESSVGDVLFNGKPSSAMSGAAPVANETGFSQLVNESLKRIEAESIKQDEAVAEQTARVDKLVEKSAVHSGEPIEYHYRGLTARGDRVLWLGATKSMKSYFALQKAMHDSCGKDWLGFRNNFGPVKVVYVDLENSNASLFGRRDFLLEQFLPTEQTLINNNLKIISAVEIIRRGVAENIEGGMSFDIGNKVLWGSIQRAAKTAEVVYIDCFYQLHSFPKVEEQRKVLQDLFKLFPGKSVTVVHHIGRASQDAIRTGKHPWLRKIGPKMWAQQIAQSINLLREVTTTFCQEFYTKTDEDDNVIETSVDFQAYGRDLVNDTLLVERIPYYHDDDEKWERILGDMPFRFKLGALSTGAANALTKLVQIGGVFPSLYQMAKAVYPGAVGTRQYTPLKELLLKGYVVDDDGEYSVSGEVDLAAVSQETADNKQSKADAVGFLRGLLWQENGSVNEGVPEEVLKGLAAQQSVNWTSIQSARSRHDIKRVDVGGGVGSGVTHWKATMRFKGKK